MAKTIDPDNADNTQSIKVEVKSAPQINDVAKPGETAASPTSRPIIVGRGPMMKQDPMVAADDSTEAAEEKTEKKLTPKTEVKIQPLSEDVKAEDSSSESKSPAEDSNVPNEEAKPEKEVAETTSSETTDESGIDSSESSEIDALASTAEAKSIAKKQEEDDKKKQEEINQIVASQKYFVPIIEGGKRASAERIVSWLFLFLLLVAIGVVLAIDAGYLNIGLDLPFDLIKN